MNITNYGSLKAKVADYTKRRDLGSVIPDFIQAAHVKLTEAVGPLDTVDAAGTPTGSYDLVEDGDYNALLAYSKSTMFYLNGALAEAYLYLRDMEMAGVYDAKFQRDLSALYMKGRLRQLGHVSRGQVLMASLRLTGNPHNDAWEIDRTYVRTIPDRPLKLVSYASDAMPKASEWPGCLVWLSDLKETATSDGANWISASGVTL